MKVIRLLWLLLIPMAGMAQKTHKVTAKETLFSIGRAYNIHPRELAEYNHLPYPSGLKLGQVLKIPAGKTKSPVVKETAEVKPENAKPAPVKPESKPVEAIPVVTAKKEMPEKAAVVKTPIYHTVAPKETLYHLSKKFKLPVDEIKKLNHLKADGLKPGTKLLVGYTQSKKAPVKEIIQVSEATIDMAETKTAVPPAKPATVEKPVVTEKPVDVISVNNESKPTPPTEPVPVKAFEPSAEPTHANARLTEGFFKTEFQKLPETNNRKEASGLGGVFKTENGWSDSKYYCLFNQAAPGTIIKITRTDNGAVIYAKVLDVIPDMSKNKDLVVVISNAGAQKLGLTQDKFDCSIQY
jgi:LysM repeat protein